MIILIGSLLYLALYMTNNKTKRVIMMDISHVIPYFSYVKPKTLITSNAKASYKRRNVKINQ